MRRQKISECIGRLVNEGFASHDAFALRRASMTLHRWHELECGDGNEYGSWAIARGRKAGKEFEHDDDGKPFHEWHYHRGDVKAVYRAIPDRERGARERIAVHQDNEKALQIADDIMAKLEDYPVINEDHWSELEYNEVADYWDSLSPREKVDMAMAERKRYHWLQHVPVWRYGRLSYGEFPDDEIGRALEETLRGV